MSWAVIYVFFRWNISWTFSFSSPNPTFSERGKKGMYEHIKWIECRAFCAHMQTQFCTLHNNGVNEKSKTVYIFSSALATLERSIFSGWFFQWQQFPFNFSESLNSGSGSDSCKRYSKMHEFNFSIFGSLSHVLQLKLFVIFTS